MLVAKPLVCYQSMSCEALQYHVLIFNIVLDTVGFKFKLLLVAFNGLENQILHMTTLLSQHSCQHDSLPHWFSCFLPVPVSQHLERQRPLNARFLFGRCSTVKCAICIQVTVADELILVKFQTTDPRPSTWIRRFFAGGFMAKHKVRAAARKNVDRVLFLY